MRRHARRCGVGTLLITVLIILASLFIMAMMQYFAGSVTKGKRILAHIAATDYANEAALDEAVVWFRGHCNNPQSKHKQKDAAQKLHSQLVKTGDSSAETDFEPDATIEMFKKLHKDLKFENKNRVHIMVDKVQEIGKGKLPKGTFHETEGLVHFSVTSRYETTRKTSVRTLQFRQVVVAPPRDFSNYQFVATGFRYLGRRVRKYVSEQQILADIIAAAAERIYFAFSMLTYIAKPDDAAIGGGGPFMVGKTFIDAVADKARQMSGNSDPAAALESVKGQLEGGVGQKDGLAYWRAQYNNQNFNVDYVKAMASANTSNLTKVLSELKSEFNFKPGEGGALSPSDPYPLSFSAEGKQPETTDKVLGSAAGYNFKPAQKWGFGGKLDGDMFKPADIKFNSANGGEITLQALSEVPRIVVPKRPNGEWRLSELEFFIHPPPTIPKDAEPADSALEVKGLSPQDVASVSTKVTVDDIKKLSSGNSGGSNHFVDLAQTKGDWGDKFKELGQDDDKGGVKPDDYKVPAMQLHHPKSFPDWAFRFPKEWWQDGFKKHYEAFVKWKDAVKGSAKYYRDKMQERNDKYGEKILVVESTAGQDAPDVPAPPEIYKRASFQFKTAKDFTDAMKALQSATGVNDALCLNGVYYIGDAPPEPSSSSSSTGTPAPTGGGTPQTVEIPEGQYVGQGEIVTDKLVIKKGMKAVKDKSGQLVLYSAGTGDDQTFEIESKEDIDASVVTRATLKAKESPKITGVFVIKDAMCREAVQRGSKDELKEIDYYYRRLPNIRIKHPDFNQEPVNYSHMTFSPYRVSSGGARRAN